MKREKKIILIWLGIFTAVVLWITLPILIDTVRVPLF